MTESEIHIEKRFECDGTDGSATGRPQGRIFTPKIVHKTCREVANMSVLITQGTGHGHGDQVNVESGFWE